MRMIDADALTVTHINEADVLGYKLKYGTGIPVVRLAEVEYAPTIEPERPSGRKLYQAGYAEGYKAGQEEQKTGKWIRMPMVCYGGGTITEYECSECSEHQMIESKWCPNCGARMVQEGEDNDRT